MSARMRLRTGKSESAIAGWIDYTVAVTFLSLRVCEYPHTAQVLLFQLSSNNGSVNEQSIHIVDKLLESLNIPLLKENTLSLFPWWNPALLDCCSPQWGWFLAWCLGAAQGWLGPFLNLCLMKLKEGSFKAFLEIPKALQFGHWPDLFSDSFWRMRIDFIL